MREISTVKNKLVRDELLDLATKDRRGLAR
jgi:hypothetical protein